MKKIFVSFIALLLMFTLVYSLTTTCFAANTNFSIAEHDTAAKGSDFDKAAKNITGIILAAMRYAGAGIALISLVLIATKYLYSSPGEKADYKKNLVVFAIGGVGMFSVGTIMTILQKFASETIKVGS